MKLFVPVIFLGLLSAPLPGLADLPCEADEIHARSIPPEAKWTKAEPTRNLGKQDQGWIKQALGFDWRLVHTKDFAFIPVPTARKTPLFFIQRFDLDWCGSGGCTMTLYDCMLDKNERGECTQIWSSWAEDVWFPGTGDKTYPDFITGGTDLFSYEKGKYRAVCNVTIKHS